jgi:hypothetical protein
LPGGLPPVSPPQGLAATIVVGVGLYLRQHFVISAPAVYRLALSQLKASKAVTEV